MWCVEYDEVDEVFTINGEEIEQGDAIAVKTAKGTYALKDFDHEAAERRVPSAFIAALQGGLDGHKGAVSQAKKAMWRMRRLASLQWRDLEAIGIELAGCNELYGAPWEFPNMEEALAPGGRLFGKKYPLHAFLGAQPIYVDQQVLNVPYVVIMDCSVAPPDFLADHRLQQEKEVLIPMAQLSMSWAPYLPYSLSGIGPNELPKQCRINVLDWKRRPENFAPLMILKEIKELCELYPTDKDPDMLRRAEGLVNWTLPDAYKVNGNKYVACMKRMKDMDPGQCKKEIAALEDDVDPRFFEQLHKWEYLAPYVVRPALFPKGPNDVTAVNFAFDWKTKDGEARQDRLVFDKEVDRLAYFLEDFEENHPDCDPASLGEDGTLLKQAVKAAFVAQRQVEASAFEEKLERLQAYTPEQITKLDAMTVYKFYPNHPTIDIKKFLDRKVNIYIGDADHVVPPVDDYAAPSSPVAKGRGASAFATPQSSVKTKRVFPDTEEDEKPAKRGRAPASGAKKRTKSPARKRTRTPSRTPRKRN